MQGLEEEMIQRYSAIRWWKTHIDEEGADGQLVLYSDHLAAIAEKDREIAELKKEWPRCDNDIGGGILCNAEIVDGGEGFGMFCPLCDLRDEIAELKEKLTAITNAYKKGQRIIDDSLTGRQWLIEQEAIKEATNWRKP